MRRGPRWYSGSADAIFQNLNLLDDERPTHVMVFGADHIYRMDPRQMLEQHLDTGAGLTVAGIRVPRSEANQFGVIDVGEGTLIKGFLEKPSDPPGLPDNPDQTLASMGNYLFNADLLRELVTLDAADEDSKHDMGGDIVPRLVASGDAHVYDFNSNEVPGESQVDHAYWRDVGTLQAYFDANMDLVRPEPEFNLYNFEWPILTSGRLFPPMKVTEHHLKPSSIANTMICSGAIVSGATINEALLSPGVNIGDRAIVERAVLLDGVQVGAGAEVRNAIIDKGVVIPEGYQLGVDLDHDRERFAGCEGCVVTDEGLVVVGKGETLRM
jgi:glucose-1-phosphate adenylyltransferase